jgi:hypothetical protein
MIKMEVMFMNNQNSKKQEENMQSQQTFNSLGLDPEEQVMNGNYGMVETDIEDVGYMHDEGQRKQPDEQ